MRVKKSYFWIGALSLHAVTTFKNSSNKKTFYFYFWGIHEYARLIKQERERINSPRCTAIPPFGTDVKKITSENSNGKYDCWKRSQFHFREVAAKPRQARGRGVYYTSTTSMVEFVRATRGRKFRNCVREPIFFGRDESDAIVSDTRVSSFTSFLCKAPCKWLALESTTLIPLRLLLVLHSLSPRNYIPVCTAYNTCTIVPTLAYKLS